MEKGAVKKTLDIFINGLKKHSPTICIAGGIVLMGAAAVLAVKNTPKALEHIEEMKKDISEPKKTDKIKAAWKDFVVPACCFACGTALILAARHQYVSSIAAIGTVAALQSEKTDILVDSLKEVVGDNEADKILDKAAEKEIQAHPVKNTEVIVCRKGNVLCYDVTAGRYFRSNKDVIDTAVCELNYRMTDEITLVLNDYYEEIGLPDTYIGGLVGWDIKNGPIRPRYTSTLSEDDEPVLVVDFEKRPNFLYL